MQQELDVALYDLFTGKEELLPLWLRFRPAVEALGGDIRVERRDRYAEFDRRGSVFVLAEPTSDHVLKVGLHNPGLPFDRRFHAADGWGSRRITHRVDLSEEAVVDDELHARLHEAYLLAWDDEPR
jgi:hypothetical protein